MREFDRNFSRRWHFWNLNVNFLFLVDKSNDVNRPNNVEYGILKVYANIHNLKVTLKKITSRKYLCTFMSLRDSRKIKGN